MTDTLRFDNTRTKDMVHVIKELKTIGFIFEDKKVKGSWKFTSNAEIVKKDAKNILVANSYKELKDEVKKYYG